MSIAYTLVIANVAGGATYYVDDANGSDADPGTSDRPWKTLGRSYPTYSGAGTKVVEGDTVYFKNGDYGEFRETGLAGNRTNWITYSAAAGHSPDLSNIYVSDGNYDAYLKWSGFNVKNGVSLRYGSYFYVYDCNITSTPQPYGEGGYYYPYFGGGGIQQTGVWGKYNANHVTIENCDIQYTCRGIRCGEDGGSYWTIKNNTIHRTAEDGIRPDGTTHLLIEGNRIYDTHKGRTGFALVGTASGTFQIGETVIQAGTNAEGVIYAIPNPSTNVSVYTTSQTLFSTAAGGGGAVTGQSSGATMSNITKCDYSHSDCLQIESSATVTDIVIRGNTFIPSLSGNVYLSFYGNGTDVTIENNLSHETGANAFSVGGVASGLSIWNNTFPDGLNFSRGYSTVNPCIVDSFYNNITKSLAISDDADPVYVRVVSHGNNIFGSNPNGAGGPTYPFAINSTEAITSHFNALFTNVAGNDYTLAAGSAAINFGNAAYGPTTDKNGNARVGAPDAGCYEYGSSKSGNHAPVLKSISSKSVNENALLTFTISATDADGDMITYSAQDLPTGATFSGRTFAWIPGYTQAGAHNVTFVASDGTDTDSETVTITVNNVNRAPALATIDNKSVSEGSLLSFSLSATDADGDTVTYTASSLPAGSAFAGSTFTWTPGYTQAGSFQVTFTASDGHAQDSETVTITINNTNRAPVLDAIPDKSINENTLLTFEVSATDPDGDPLGYSATGLPSGATFAGQTFSWTPSVSQADSSHQVTFVAGDGQLDDAQIMTITVNDTLAPSVTNLSPAASSIQAPLNSLIALHVTDAGKGVSASTVTITLDGSTIYSGDTSNYVSATGNCRRTGTKADYAYAYQSGQNFDFDQTQTVAVNATDLGGNVMSEQAYSFRTEMRSFGQNKLLGSDIEGLDKGAPATVRDSSGNIWAVWHAGPAGSRDIYLAKLTAGSTSFGAGVQITTDAADQCNAAVALGTDDKLYVVWQDNRLGDWDVHGSTSADGTDWSAQQRISDSNDNQINPAIAVDRQSPNRAHVVWQDDLAGNQDIYIATSSNSFVTSTVARITSDTADQTAPAVATSSSNTVYVLWTDARNSSKDIYGAAGSSWTNIPVVTKVADQSSPAIAAESAGSVLHILWVDQTSGNSDIYYASSNGLPSSPLTGTNLIDDTSGAEQTSPAIAVTGSTGSSLKVFACWADERNILGGTSDTDIYMVQANAGSGTNALISDGSTNSSQTEPATGTDRYGYPYIVWTDGRNTNSEIYYAASTYLQPAALTSKQITASAGGTVGADPNAISGPDDVSVVAPGGACPYDVTISITKIENPQEFAARQLSSYDFGPSGIEFSRPVTVTIPYTVASSGTSPSAYWYDSLTGALSQQGITEIKIIELSASLHALRFKTTHFTPFYVVLATAGGGGGGGGCSMSPHQGAKWPDGQGNVVEFLVPYLGLAVVMLVLRLRDACNCRLQGPLAGARSILKGQR